MTTRSTLSTSACVAIAVALLWILGGCTTKPPEWGVEETLSLKSEQGRTWAVAPALNLSGEPGVDPLLQADIVFGELQQVRGLNVIPVNRVAEVYAALGLSQVENEEQAQVVMRLLDADGLVVPTVTAFDPYDPPVVGASLQLFRKDRLFTLPEAIDPVVMSRMASPPPEQVAYQPGQDILQAVGLFDANAGSVRAAVYRYAAGRNDPLGPLGEREYFKSMDRYCAFAWHQLIRQLVEADGA